MTDLREAAQMALDALEVSTDWDMGATGKQAQSIRAITALRAALAQPERKLWLWKNFVDGRPEYWAFDNPYPTNLDNGDPQTLGQPCGYAIFKQSRDGSCGRTEEQVLREMKSVTAPPQRECAGTAHDRREWQGLTDDDFIGLTTPQIFAMKFAEAKLREKNS